MTRELTAGPAKEKTMDAVRVPLNAYWVFWLFLIAGFAGDLVEVVFWLVTRGELISRSSLLYGPFSVVWGAGAVLLTIVFHRMDDQSAGRIFFTGAALGGVYEYICSWLQEILFGACFWDYRHLPLNLDGRVNLGFCLFWGLAAILWVRLAYPMLCRFVGRIPRQTGRRVAAAAAAFLLFSGALSAAALCRMDQRREGVPALGAVSRFLDEQFPDSVLRARYPNMGILSEIGWYGGDAE
ncbi:MAG: putative ABC transporter permease [Oscillospiraceae bacterium]